MFKINKCLRNNSNITAILTNKCSKKGLSSGEGGLPRQADVVIVGKLDYFELHN